MKKIMYMLLMMCFLLLQTSIVSGKTLPPGTSANVPPNVLIVFDTSGSMTFDVNNGTYTLGDGSDNHWGEDTDALNNDQNNPDNYYNTTALGFPPNDSRMYVGKHVLWDIMHDPSLTQGIKYGLMRYNQTETGSQYEDWADWYYSSNPNSGILLPNSTDYIYYYLDDGCSKEGDLLVECGANTVSLITDWIDGTENYPNNKELRGEGATPLANTLFSAKEYYEGDLAAFSSPIFDVYQNSYVIILTDGRETCGGDPVGAAGQLRNLSYDSDSDGTDEAYDVKTFVIGLALAVDQQQQLDDIAFAGGTTSAFFPDNYNELKNALIQIIGGIYAENYTTTSPLDYAGRVGKRQ